MERIVRRRANSALCSDTYSYESSTLTIHQGPPNAENLESSAGDEHETDIPPCPICGGLDKRWEHYLGQQPSAAADLVRSANSGCDTCFLLLSGIRKFFPGWGLPKDENGYEGTLAIHPTLGKPLVVLLCFLKNLPVSDMGDVIRQLYIEFYTLENEPCVFELIGPGVPVPPDVMDCVKYVPSWIEECLKTHKNCRTPTAAGSDDIYEKQIAQLPARVLALGDGENWKNVSLHISSPGEKDRYVCLSHSWGGEQPLQTTIATLDQHRTGIPWDDFPQLFQYAIAVTAMLGYRFLWIDSLCIVQDDMKDWEQESASMGRIYGNSILTLSAAWSRSATKGIHALDEEFTKSVAIPIINTESTLKGNVFVRRGLHYNQERDGIIPPLQRRGWTLQEYLLPSRVLHFEYAELMWECESARYCVCGSRAEVTNATEKTRFSELLRSANNLGLKNGIYYSTEWQNIVQLYSERRITVGSDKLPALSGIAKALRFVSQWHYLAGLWWEDICNGMMWYCDGTKSHRKAVKYRAPSWSWAAVDGVVKYSLPISIHDADTGISAVYFMVDRFLFSPLEADCRSSTIDETGAVQGGYLKVSGVLVKAKYRYLETLPVGSQNRYICERDGKEVSIYIDFSAAHTDLDTLPKTGDTISVLLLATFIPLPHSPDIPSGFAALILQDSNRTPGAFERLGYISSLDQSPLSWFENVKTEEVILV